MLASGITSDNGCCWSAQTALVAVSGCRQALHIQHRPLRRTTRHTRSPRFAVFLGWDISDGA